MNIYEGEGTEGILNLHAAAAELKSVGSITSESARRAAVAEINTAALLDIASSLRVVAAEALAAMPSPFVGEDSGSEPEDDGPRDFLVEGDLVAVNGLDDPAEVIGFGFTEGAAYAMIRLVDGSETRAWLDTLARLVGDERDDDTMQDASEAESAAGKMLFGDGPDMLEPPAPEDLVDDIDDDFEGDSTPAEDLVDDIDDDFEGDSTPAETKSALDLLKANEAERKAAKKSGAKKGKKS